MKPPKSNITPLPIYQNRRSFIKGAIALGLLPSEVLSQTINKTCEQFSPPLNSSDHITEYKHVTSYNNYYEFTTNKKMVKHIAKYFDTEGWQLSVDGLVENPITLDKHTINELPHCERTYRFRCVEGWSAVIPWRGFELNKLINMAQPKTQAKYVQFTSLYSPKQMPGQRSSILPWPYKEGLRLDEAMHPLTILATGMYAKALPNQNGAPLRLVVPWKYGFKSAKALTQITLLDKQPTSSWSSVAPSEYGFYANVNPNVGHPRWNQRRELRLGDSKKIRTEMFNGYFDEVRSLYALDDIDSLF